MTLETLKNATKVIGVKQVTKSVNKDSAMCVFLADDADERVLMPLKALCESKQVAIVKVETMAEIGKACLIEVGAAAAAILK
jgi:large subunit ribosomal protein L7A